MAENLFNIDGTFFSNSDTNSFDQSGAGVITGGGGNTFGTGTSLTSSTSNYRNIQFTVTSNPIGSAIFIDNTNTFQVTPHTFTFTEAELLTPKRIDVRRANVLSTEEYIISAEAIQDIITGGGSGGGGGFIDRDFGTGFGRETVVDGGSERRENIR